MIFSSDANHFVHKLTHYNCKEKKIPIESTVLITSHNGAYNSSLFEISVEPKILLINHANRKLNSHINPSIWTIFDSVEKLDSLNVQQLDSFLKQNALEGEKNLESIKDKNFDQLVWNFPFKETESIDYNKEYYERDQNLGDSVESSEEHSEFKKDSNDTTESTESGENLDEKLNDSEDIDTKNIQHSKRISKPTLEFGNSSNAVKSDPQKMTNKYNYEQLLEEENQLKN